MEKNVFINQMGYMENAVKRVITKIPAESFQIIGENGTAFVGRLVPAGLDECSQDFIYEGDFTALQEPGTYYADVCGEHSFSFRIDSQVYQSVLFDTMKAFYYLRCGMELTEEYAGEYVHPACHTEVALEWENEAVSKEVNGGWHDAGDYGRYITAGACALAHLLFAYKMYPNVFIDREFQIPESGNGTPDILNECRYELEWFLKMQRSDGGVYHKATTARHADFVMPQEDTNQMYLLPVSSMATADFVAVTAMASTVYQEYDREFAAQLLEAARLSYKWLLETPDFVGFRNPEGCGTGEYGERDDLSNRFWAAVAMYDATGEEFYKGEIRKTMQKDFPLWALGYGEVGGFGALLYLLSWQEKEQDLVSLFKNKLSEEYQHVKQLADTCKYGASMGETDYCWGSNMVLMKHGMIFAIGEYFGIAGEEAYVYAQKQLDYLLGVNGLGISYISGSGEYAINEPHLRPAHADQVKACIPGMVSGGPNRHPADPDARRLIEKNTPPMKCFADHVGCYSLNEITIYWNSPTVFVISFLLN